MENKTYFKIFNWQIFQYTQIENIHIFHIKDTYKQNTTILINYLYLISFKNGVIWTPRFQKYYGQGSIENRRIPVTGPEANWLGAQNKAPPVHPQRHGRPNPNDNVPRQGTTRWYSGFPNGEVGSRQFGIVGILKAAEGQTRWQYWSWLVGWRARLRASSRWVLWDCFWVRSLLHEIQGPK